MDTVSCPVCGRKCNGKIGVSSHLFKNKDEDHKIFIQKTDEMIDKAFFEDISCENFMEREDCFVSSTYVYEHWQKMPGFKERVSRLNSQHMKEEWKNGRQLPKNFTNAGRPYDLNKKTTISKEQHDEIIKLFNSDIGTTQIAKQVGCNVKTVHRTFTREFGKQATRERGKKLQSLTCKSAAAGNNKFNIESDTGKAIVDAFYKDEGLKTVSNRLNIGTCVIKRVWKEKFGEENYQKRCARLIGLQRERAAKTLQKAKFMGSRNEILCYQLLKEKLSSLSIIHHDYTIIPKLEVDISIPELKIAITWDGIGHRKPVFGENAFKRVCANDYKREQFFIKEGWRQISVVDNGNHNPTFVNKITDKIVCIITHQWQGKLELSNETL